MSKGSSRSTLVTYYCFIMSIPGEWHSFSSEEAANSPHSALRATCCRSRASPNPGPVTPNSRTCPLPQTETQLRERMKEQSQVEQLKAEVEALNSRLQSVEAAKRR